MTIDVSTGTKQKMTMKLKANKSSGNMSVKKAAALLCKSEQFVRVGLQRGIFNWGYAVKMSDRWTYHISEQKLRDYLGINDETL